MKSLPIMLGGQRIELYGKKLVWLPALKLLCASDIHFEKGSFFGKFGTLLPPYDSLETLSMLENAVAYFQPEIFIALGDSFHDKNAAQRLQPDVRGRLVTLINSIAKWVWVTGNHDPEITNNIPGERHEELNQRGIWFRHQLIPGDESPEISGHYHPKIRIELRGTYISSACFVHTGKKLIVPAFGKYTGGLNIDDIKFLQTIPRAGQNIFLTYKENIYAL